MMVSILVSLKISFFSKNKRAKQWKMDHIIVGLGFYMSFDYKKNIEQR